jgi:ATP-binding cassette subfamily B protein
MVAVGVVNPTNIHGELGGMQEMSLWRLYFLALGMLRSSWNMVVLVLGSNLLVGAIPPVEQVLLGRAVDALTAGESPIALVIGWGALGVGGILLGALVARAADRIAHRHRVKALEQGFEKAIGASLELDTKDTGTKGHIIQSGADNLFRLWLSFFREGFASLVTVVVLVPVAIFTDGRMAIVLLVIGCIYLFCTSIVLARTSHLQRTVTKHHQALSGRIADVLANVSLVWSYDRTREEVAGVKQIGAQLLGAQYPVLNWWATVSILVRSASTVGMILILIVGSAFVSDGSLSVGELVSFMGFSTLLVGRLDQVSHFVLELSAQGPPIEAYFDQLGSAFPTPSTLSLNDLGVINGEIRYDGVSYCFPEGKRAVHDLTFAVAAGTTTALVGRTGSGKTTALALLQGIRKPQKGRIEIDGRDISTVSESSLRKAVAVVSQEPLLFNRSVLENMLIGKPGATPDQIAQACRLADAHNFVMAKSNGYNFVVGEKGARLSGGERQRLAIARAMIKDAPILVLDEATSAIDPETEARIRLPIQELRQGRTTLVIAHRLSTVASADLILVLEDGRIVESGTYAKLISSRGAFYRLFAEGQFASLSGSN